MEAGAVVRLNAHLGPGRVRQVDAAGGVAARSVAHGSLRRLALARRHGRRPTSFWTNAGDRAGQGSPWRRYDSAGCPGRSPGANRVGPHHAVERSWPQLQATCGWCSTTTTWSTSAEIDSGVTLLPRASSGPGAPRHQHEGRPRSGAARWRVRGELVEIRATDLRFTSAEATAYLTAATGLQLAAADVTALEDRTEGWIAALQLAALSGPSPKPQPWPPWPAGCSSSPSRSSTPSWTPPSPPRPSTRSVRRRRSSWPSSRSSASPGSTCGRSRRSGCWA